jgi:GTPase SAR1 family protein
LTDDEKDTISIYSNFLRIQCEQIQHLSVDERACQLPSIITKLINRNDSKIVFMGMPNSGKTSTKMFFFKNFQSLQILSQTNEPTVGLESELFSLMAMKINLIDAAGQELDRWYSEPEDWISGTDLVIFFFSPDDWIKDAQKVKDYIIRLKNLIQKLNPQAKLKVFCHKCDLIPKDDSKITLEITSFEKQVQIPFSFTSIQNGGNFALMSSFYYIFQDFSVLIMIFKSLIQPIVKKYHFDPMYLIDTKNRILAYFPSESTNLELQEKIRSFYPIWVESYHASIGKKPPVIVFWIDSEKTFVIGLEMTKLYYQFSYLLFRSNTIADLDALLIEYEKIFVIK